MMRELGSFGETPRQSSFSPSAETKGDHPCDYTPFNVLHTLPHIAGIFSSATPMPSASPKPPLPERNEVLLTRASLPAILTDLSNRLLPYFDGKPVRLVVHGGAVMVLHPLLACRENTRDVDYNHRSFEAEWISRGVMDAGPRLRTCIAATAKAFGLGRDWMNACADVALPMSIE